MISISGIKYQRELEELPYFNKQTASLLIGKKGRNLDKKIASLVKKNYLIRLKQGTYVASSFVERQADKGLYLEYLSNILRYPSYLSLEYVLAGYNLIPEATYVYTSVTVKSTRSYTNQLGNFIYRNVKARLFTGYRQKEFGEKSVLIATKAKALFDYLYLKRNIASDLAYEIKEGLRINWGSFGKRDEDEFGEYVKAAGSAKMREFFKLLAELASKGDSFQS